MSAKYNSWQEVYSEQSGIPLEEILAEQEVKEAQQREEQKQEQKEQMIEGMQSFVLYGTLALIAVAVLIYIKKSLKKGRHMMYCRKCGKVIQEDSAFCKYCGTGVIKNKSEIPYETNPVIGTEIAIHEEPDQEEDHILNNNVAPVEIKHPSMKWYKALVNFFIPATLIISPIETIGSLYLSTKSIYSNSNNLIDYFINSTDGLVNTLSMIMYIFLVALLFFAYKGIKNFTETGYKYIMMFFILSMLYPIITILIYTPVYDTSYVTFYEKTVGSAIYNIIYCIPNLIYFKKRKHLFVDNRNSTSIK